MIYFVLFLMVILVGLSLYVTAKLIISSFDTEVSKVEYRNTTIQFVVLLVLLAGDITQFYYLSH